MGALRDPKHWAEVMADAWEIAGKMPNPDFRKALRQLAEKRLGTPLKVPNEVFKGNAFFQQYAKSGRPLIDTYFGRPAAGAAAAGWETGLCSSSVGSRSEAATKALRLRLTG